MNETPAQNRRQASRDYPQPAHAATKHASSNPDPSAGLSIVIPTYNAVGTVEPLLEQLAAMLEAGGGKYQVILTDDASTDATVPVLRERYPQFHFVESASNTGFGPNCNRGIAAAMLGYVALVNTDIELVGNPFPRLTAALHADQQRLFLMPLIYNTARCQIENLQQLLQSRGLAWNADLPLHSRFSSALRSALSAGVAPAAAFSAVSDAGVEDALLCGACFVCATARLREIGGFDPRYAPFYWEDVDLGLRGQAAAFKAPGVLTSCLVLHRHSESINQNVGPAKFRYLRLNQLRFVLRHFHPWLWHCPFQEGAPSGKPPVVAEWRKLQARLLLLLRAVRECFGGDPALRVAYFRAAFGARDV